MTAGMPWMSRRTSFANSARNASTLFAVSAAMMRFQRSVTAWLTAAWSIGGGAGGGAGAGVLQPASARASTTRVLRMEESSGEVGMVGEATRLPDGSKDAATQVSDAIATLGRRYQQLAHIQAQV